MSLCQDQGNLIVYGDQTVHINSLFIKIKKYYLPLATSKTIFFQEMEQIIYHPQGLVDVKWGLMGQKMNNWFGFDEKRKEKKGYFEIIMKDNFIRPSFSPSDPETALETILSFRKHKKPEQLNNIEVNQISTTGQSQNLTVTNGENKTETFSKCFIQENEMDDRIDEIKQNTKNGQVKFERTVLGDITNQQLGNKASDGLNTIDKKEVSGNRSVDAKYCKVEKDDRDLNTDYNQINIDDDQAQIDFDGNYISSDDQHSLSSSQQQQFSQTQSQPSSSQWSFEDINQQLQPGYTK